MSAAFVRGVSGIDPALGALAHDGACIHVPPPHRIAYARPAQPVENAQTRTPYGIEGAVRGRKQENAMAGASYSCEADRVKPPPAAELCGPDDLIVKEAPWPRRSTTRCVPVR